MITQELINFIQSQKSQGKSKEEIKSSLMQNNWLEQDIETVFQQLQTPPPANPVPAQTLAHDNHLPVVILLLVFVYPIGIIFMWKWMKSWPKWLKWLLTLFLFLPIVLIVVSLIILITLNPSQQLAKAQNVQRQNDLTAIVNSVNEYKADHNGQPPTGVKTTPTEISKQEADICSSIVPTYLGALPSDPALNIKTPIENCFQLYDTGYMIFTDSSGKIIVTAPHSGNPPVTVGR